MFNINKIKDSDKKKYEVKKTIIESNPEYKPFKIKIKKKKKR